MFKTRDNETELLIDLIQGALGEEGHMTKRVSDSDKYSTTEYDCIEIKGNDGHYYSLGITKRADRERPYDEWKTQGRFERANETFDKI